MTRLLDYERFTESAGTRISDSVKREEKPGSTIQ
jgi:hypothetical protein